jgi:hypothetical protein
MPGRLVDAPVEPFTAEWRAGWLGPRKLAMLTTSLRDPSRFVAYGTDGRIAFRVEGSLGADLKRFTDRMAIDGAELLLPPYTALASSPGQISFPDPLTVQRCFDMRLRLGGAAA